jgi:hypothetical protein
MSSTRNAEATGTVAVPRLAEIVDSEIVEGEIVDDAPVSPPATVVQAVIVRPVQIVKVVVRHDHTRARWSAPRVRADWRVRRGKAAVGFEVDVPV